MTETRTPTARFVTFGCKVNQYDTQLLREAARAGGYAESDGPADLMVVNTCTVTEHGGAEARKAIRRLARENPGARIYVTGCYAGSDAGVAAKLPGVAAVIPNDRRDELLRMLHPEIAAGPFIERTVTTLQGRTRAFLKVQDGCYLRCTYCIIPRVRPPVASKRPDTVVREVRDLVAAGHREVVLTGVHVGAYGRDGPGRGDRDALAALMKRILDETDLERLRLSSIEAFEVTPALLDLYASEPRLAPHLHVPLQSGSAAVLRRMKRRYHPERFRRVAARIREAVPDAALTTDVIVGFPGETEEDFRATLDLLRDTRVMKTHVFPYSPRAGTPAAERAPVPSDEVRRRVRRADRLSRRLAAEYARGRLGGVEGVLVEHRRLGGRLTGFTGRYLRVHFDGPDDRMGRIVPVRLLSLADAGVEAEIA